MITAGIDAGAKTVKVVLVKDREIIAKSLGLAGIDTNSAAEKLYEEVLNQAGLKADEVSKIVATGSGSKSVKRAKETMTEVSAAAKGATALFSGVHVVIDVGAEEGRAIKTDDHGKVVDFAINEKCAAGAGAFTEAMARALEIPLEEFGAFSLKSDKKIPMNAQCAVFAESEVVSLLHAKTPKEDIAHAVHDAIADRIVSMVRRVGIEKEVVVTGGLAKNIGFIKSLENGLGLGVLIPDEPEFTGAYGAALT